MLEVTVVCYQCGQVVNLDRPVGRSDTCPNCGAYLRCCRNCRFFDTSAPNQCREPQAEPVRDKEMANFCGYFEPATQHKSDWAQPPKRDRAAEARRKLDELFRKKDSG